MIKSILIEDEINVREGLKKMIGIIAPQVQIIAETAFVKEAVELINTHKPELIFLDIELEDGTGFDVLNQVKLDGLNILFTTAYNQHAIKAFKYSAVDYLLKPIDPTELDSAIKRVDLKIQNNTAYQELLQTLKDNLNNVDKKIVLKTTNQNHIINTQDIIRLEADGAYTNFITTSKKIITSKNLKYYQEILDDNFIRCHQSHLINKNHIKGVKSSSIIMSNSDLVPISSRKKVEISKLIN